MDPDENKPDFDESTGWQHRLSGRWLELYERNALLRHLIHEPLFLAAILSVVFVAGGVALVLPKRWNPAPPGFSKNIRVSLLDYIQAWSLRRSARQAEAAGRWDDALAAWRGALANNLASLDSLRGTFSLLQRAPWSRSANLGLIFVAGDILLEVDHTNRTDACLIADVLERHRLPELALEALRPFESDLRPEEDAVWLRSLLTSGRIQAFAERWDRHRDRYAADPVLALYRAAYDAGWGGVDNAVSGLQVLRKAREVPDRRLVAERLMGAVALQRDDVEEYGRVLESLIQQQSTLVQDHAAWWNLLRVHGRTNEAVTLAKAYQPVPPPTPVEAVHLARAWLGLGLLNEGITFFHDHATRYGLSLEVWATYLDLLMIKGDWNEVRRVAADLRANTTRRDDLLAVSLYADIRADLTEGRRTAVKDALQRLREAEIQNPQLTVRFASGLSAAGEFETAWVLLRKIEKVRADAPDYWFEVLTAAQGRRDVDGMQNASRQLIRLAPDNPTARVLRLVVLLGSRSEPGEALALSLGLVNQGVQSASMAVNHAMALLLNRRADEALEFLGRLPPDQLPADTLNSWRIAMTDALSQLGRYPDAVEIGAKADTAVLLPVQETWFRELLHNARERAANPGRPSKS